MFQEIFKIGTIRADDAILLNFATVKVWKYIFLIVFHKLGR